MRAGAPAGRHGPCSGRAVPGTEPTIQSAQSVGLALQKGDQLEGFRAGADGCIDDELAFVRPWGFDLAEISIPTIIPHITADLLVPCSHGQWLASHIHDAKARLEDGDGHFSLTLRALDHMLDELANAA